MKKIGNKLSPLCFLSDNRLVCYRLGNLVIIEHDKIIGSYPLFSSGKERIIGLSNALYRLFRLGIRAAEAIDEKKIVLSVGNTLYEYDFIEKKLSDGYLIGDDIRPLIFRTVTGLTSIDDGIYFGGYFGTRNKKPVSVYKRVETDSWKIVFTFPQGTIDHVHTIVSDVFRDCLWIFTGDLGEASAIWKVTENFKKVERIICDDQKYRGCVAFALPEGLLYATDAPFSDNFIYLLNPETMQLREIMPIGGSCIYGSQWQDKFVFSSTVEGDGRDVSRIEFLFGRKLGAGIKDMYVRLYLGNLREGFKEIYKEKKDYMPFYTFQYGGFKFPYGVNNGNILYFQPVATNKNDLSLMGYPSV